MLKAILYNKSASRIEIDQRARDARLRLEQIERPLAPRAAVTASCATRVLYRFSFITLGEGWRTSRDRGPLNIRRPLVSKIHWGWVPSAL
jgi:hypothetical protein